MCVCVYVRVCVSACVRVRVCVCVCVCVHFYISHTISKSQKTNLSDELFSLHSSCYEKAQKARALSCLEKSKNHEVYINYIYIKVNISQWKQSFILHNKKSKGSNYAVT